MLNVAVEVLVLISAGLAWCIVAALPLEPGSSVDQVLLLCPSEPVRPCKFGWCHSGRKMTGAHASLAASGTFSFTTFRRVFCRPILEWDLAVSGGPMLY
ncbi:hypothetical protein U1Q18_037641 [Sarracenia purpurea var. burkii]